MTIKHHPIVGVVSPFIDKRHGTERVLAEQVERLARDFGWEFHLYCERAEDLAALRTFQSWRASGSRTGSLVFHHVPGIRGPHLLRFIWWFYANRACRWWDRRMRGLHYDIIYTPGINCRDADAVSVHIVFHEFYRLVSGELELRGLSPLRWPRTLHRRLYYRLIMNLERSIYSRSGLSLSAVSGLTAAELQRFFDRTDVTVILNGVDTGLFNPAARQGRRAAVRRELAFTDDDVVVLLIGNDWKKKGLDCLLDAVALARNPSLKILVVGNDTRAPYFEAAKKLNIEPCLRFETPSGDVLRFYAVADIYAGPSLHDSFAIPPAEAMACGLPTITSSHNGGAEMIAVGENGFVLQDPRDSRELCRLLLQLVADPVLRCRIGEKAALKAQQYTWQRNAVAIKAFLEEAIERKHSQFVEGRP